MESDFQKWDWTNLKMLIAKLPRSSAEQLVLNQSKDASGCVFATENHSFKCFKLKKGREIALLVEMSGRFDAALFSSFGVLIDWNELLVTTSDILTGHGY